MNPNTQSHPQRDHIAHPLNNFPLSHAALPSPRAISITRKPYVYRHCAA